MKNKYLLIFICCILLIMGCTNNFGNKYTDNNTNFKESDMKMSNVRLSINNKKYKLKLENNKTVKDFINILPQEFTMKDLNDNEKYVYMNNSLTTTTYTPKHIEKGDIMLYKDNCLVIFYKSFDTNYNYSKIGHIIDLDELENDTITVKFEKLEK